MQHLEQLQGRLSSVSDAQLMSLSCCRVRPGVGDRTRQHVPLPHHVGLEASPTSSYIQNNLIIVREYLFYSLLLALERCSFLF